MARILVIEDQIASRDMLVTLLAYHDHVLLQAGDGVEGLAIALAERPDLVITDILMPGMDGYEFARRVRADPALARTRVMFYTATYLLEEARELAASCGVAHVLAKPAEPRVILDVVAAALAAPAPEVDLAPIDEADRTYLRLLAQTLRRKIDELKVEARAREQAEAELRRQADRDRIQAEVSRALAEVTHDSQAVLDLTARMLAELIGDTCAIRLVSDDRARFEIAAIHRRESDQLAPVEASLVERSERTGGGLLGQVLRTGQAVLLPSIAAEQLKPQVERALRPLLDRFSAFSVLAAPLRAFGQTIGVIVMRRDLASAQPFTANDQAFLQDLADRAGLAIANARLYAEQQRANAELEARVARRTAELRQRTIMIDLAGDAIIIRDYADDTVRYWNRGAERLYGWSAGEVHGQYIHRFLQTKFPAPLDEIKAELLRAGSWEGELIHRCRDGRRITVLSRWTLDGTATGAGSQPVGFLEINTDITPRKQAEAALRQARDELASTNEELMTINGQLEIEIAERTALEEQIRQSANRAQALADLSQTLFEAQMEFQPLFEAIVRRISELIGDTCVLTLLSDDRQWLNVAAMYHPDPAGLEFMRALMDSEPYRADGGLAGRVVTTGETVMIPVIPPEQVREQIQTKYIPYVDRFGMSSVLIVPLRGRRNILGTLGLARDRPGRPYTVEHQALLQSLADRAGLAIENSGLFADLRAARQEAERANLAKSEFLASMSHELRTPLNAIIGFTGTLLMKLPGPLTADQERQLKTVQGSARHLLSLINDILDLAKIESGKLKIYPEPVICQELLDEVIASLRPLAEQKGLRFAAVCPAEQIVLHTDRRALSQIIINLTNNAIKFTDRGEVRVELDRRPPAADDLAGIAVVGGRSAVVVRVVDTGSGIKPEDQRRLFRAFEQIGTGGVNRREGTGLGLHLSLRLAQLIGGRIEFESEHGVGSTFTLIIPGQ